jgi:cation transport regulator ChaC
LDLAYSARNIASVLLERKKPREAKPLFETFRDIADKLGRADPANYFVQTDRANSRAYIAQCEDQKTPEGRVRARALLQEGVKILESLKRHIGLQPIHESWLRDYQEELNELEKRAKQRE